MNSDAEIKALFAEMADLTQPICMQCEDKGEYRCCNALYCWIAKETARSYWGETLQNTDNTEIPLMGEHGCVAPAYDRPLCTVAVCRATLAKQPQSVQDRYNELYDAINAAQEKRWS